MANLNRVLLIGNLTKDPDLRFTASGSGICSFSLAINREWTGKDNQKHKDVCFVDVKVWGRQGENCAQYLKKGRSCFVEGRLEFSKWETQEGQKRSKLEVVAERVQFLGAKGGEGGGDFERPPAGDKADFDAVEEVEDDIPF